MGCCASSLSDDNDLFGRFAVIPAHIRSLINDNITEYNDTYYEKLIYDNNDDAKLYELTLKNKQETSEHYKLMDNNNTANNKCGYKYIPLVSKKKKLGFYYTWNKVFREITIVQNCDVIQYKHIYFDKNQKEIIYLMPKLKYNLFQYKRRYIKLNEYNAKIGLFQLLFQLYDLNRIGYCHCDLKLTNILIDTYNNYKVLKIIDFDHICPLYGTNINPVYQISNANQNEAFHSRKINKGMLVIVFVFLYLTGLN